MAKYVSDALRNTVGVGIPDKYGRTAPFAVTCYVPATGRSFTTRNLGLDDAERVAEIDAAKGYRVTVGLDGCG